MDLLYVGFSKHVVALDRASGEIRWDWKIPKGQEYPALLVDGNLLFVSAMGYTYCLDAQTGRLIWENELKGYGVGVACLATATASTNPERRAAAAIDDKRDRQSPSSPSHPSTM